MLPCPVMGAVCISALTPLVHPGSMTVRSDRPESQEILTKRQRRRTRRILLAEQRRKPRETQTRQQALRPSRRHGLAYCLRTLR
jgi:hypothetical protein